MLLAPSDATKTRVEYTYMCTVALALALMCLDALAACSTDVPPTTYMGDGPKLRSVD